MSSIGSKARRHARKKRVSRAAVSTVTPQAVEPHAQLRDSQGGLLGGIARHDNEWVLGLDGQIVGGSASAATILTMLKRAAAMQERAGHQVHLEFSLALQAAAQEEVGAQGLTLEQFEEQLDHQMLAADPGADSSSDSVHGPASASSAWH